MKVAFRVTLDVDMDEYPLYEDDDIPFEYIADDVADLLNESISFSVTSIKNSKGELLK